MTFTLQDIIVCITVFFTIGLYVGAFVQRRRDVKVFGPAQKLIDCWLKGENEKKGEENNVS